MQTEKGNQSGQVRISFHIGTENKRYLSKVNPTEFLRVISNLIDNALEAVDGHGNVQVTLTTRGEQIALSVKDNGRGIPETVIPKLFQRGATFGKLNGNGMGLFHAKSAIERWGGSIGVDSSPGKGTEVSILLPSVGV